MQVADSLGICSAAAESWGNTSTTTAAPWRSALLPNVAEEQTHHHLPGVAPIVTGAVPFPVIPWKIEALLHQDWDRLDVFEEVVEDGTVGIDLGDVPTGERLMAQLKELGGRAILEFAHGRSTFYDHLQGTFGVLSAWDQPFDVTRLGLVHTGYSGDLFQFFLWDATNETEREQLRLMVGSDAEELIFQFGTIDRGQLCNLATVLSQTDVDAEPIVGPQTVGHRFYKTMMVSERDAAKILLATIADYLDQMVETNGWRDHHQIDSPQVLYPGDGRPALAFYWQSTLCMAIKHHLDVVPPIFDNCTKLLRLEDETIARDAYWKVVLHEKNLSEEEQSRLLQTAIQANPFVGEPHMLLSQLFFRQELYEKAAWQAHDGLQKMYILASAWDKRLPYSQWIAYTRILLLKSKRKLQGLQHSFPLYHRVDKEAPHAENANDRNPAPYKNARGHALISLHTLVDHLR